MRTPGQGQASRPGGEGAPPKAPPLCLESGPGPQENILRTVTTAVERYPELSPFPGILCHVRRAYMVFLLS